MKSVLVIDTPPTCRECACFSALYDRVFCGATDEIIEYDYDTLEYIKPSWCPLSPLPEPKDLTVHNMSQINYRHGWNDCLKEIMKGTKK